MVVTPVVVPVIEIPDEFFAHFRAGFGAVAPLTLPGVRPIGTAVLTVSSTLSTIVSEFLTRIASGVGPIRALALTVL